MRSPSGTNAADKGLHAGLCAMAVWDIEDAVAEGVRTPAPPARGRPLRAAAAVTRVGWFVVPPRDAISRRARCGSPPDASQLRRRERDERGEDPDALRDAAAQCIAPYDWSFTS